MNKKIVLVVSLLMGLILISNVLAITASIGNARMILRAETGDVLEKSILVKNVNDVAVNILLTASGDLEKDIVIKDKNFILQPNEEKKAFFTVKVTKAGTTESKINVQFTLVGEKNGAGLSSSIIVIANETGNSYEENTDEAEVNTENNSESSSGASFGKIFERMDNKIIIVLSSTVITFIAFIILLIVYYNKLNKKDKMIIKINNQNTMDNLNQKTKKEKIKPKKRTKKSG